MPNYLLQLSYTSESWAALIEHPQDRIEATRKAVERLGGKVGTAGITLGDYDVVGILGMPDVATAAAYAMALAAGGACKDIKTTRLLSVAEGIDAMKKAGTSGYQPIVSHK